MIRFLKEHFYAGAYGFTSSVALFMRDVKAERAADACARLADRFGDKVKESGRSHLTAAIAGAIAPIVLVVAGPAYAVAKVVNHLSPDNHKAVQSEGLPLTESFTGACKAVPALMQKPDTVLVLPKGCKLK